MEKLSQKKLLWPIHNFIKLIVILCFVLLLFKNAAAQNLIQNGSFETISLCPGGAVGPNVTLAAPWQTANVFSSPWLFNTCGSYPAGVPVHFGNYTGFQYPRSGNGYAAINVYSFTIANVREYIVYPLSGVLNPGKSYCLTFYVNLVNVSHDAIDAIGAYFSDTALVCSPLFCLLNYPPQVSNPAGNILTDTLGWMQISGCFIAEGTEQYMLIGNFKTDAQTQTAINAGTAGTTYYIDDVSLVEDTTLTVNQNESENYFTLNCNPCHESIDFTIKQSESFAKIVLHDLLGKKIIETTVNSGSTKLDVSLLKNGVYFLNLNLSNGKTITKKIIVAHL